MGPAEHFELSSDDGRPTGRERPAVLLEPLPRGKVQRHAGIGYEIVQRLDVPVEQLPNVVQFFAAQLPVVAEPVVDVPKILPHDVPAQRLRHDTQLAEQLVEVPTIVSYSSLQRTVEHHVDIPVPGGEGRASGLQGSLPKQSSTAPLSSAERLTERIVEQIVGSPGGGLQDFRPVQSSSSSSQGSSALQKRITELIMEQFDFFGGGLQDFRPGKVHPLLRTVILKPDMVRRSRMSLLSWERISSTRGSAEIHWASSPRHWGTLAGGAWAPVSQYPALGTMGRGDHPPVCHRSASHEARPGQSHRCTQRLRHRLIHDVICLRFLFFQLLLVRVDPILFPSLCSSSVWCCSSVLFLCPALLCPSVFAIPLRCPSVLSLVLSLALFLLCCSSALLCNTAPRCCANVLLRRLLFLHSFIFSFSH